MKQHRIKKSYCGLFILLFLLIASSASIAQTPTTEVKEKVLPPPKNLKVLSEEPDGKGNIVRIIQYDQGMMRVTETIIMPRHIRVGNLGVRIDPDTMHKDMVLLVVDKSKYCVQVLYRKRMIRAYKATFGPTQS